MVVLNLQLVSNTRSKAVWSKMEAVSDFPMLCLWINGTVIIYEFDIISQHFVKETKKFNSGAGH